MIFFIYPNFFGYFYKKKSLFENGFLKEATGNGDIDVSSLADEGIIPLMVDEEMQSLVHPGISSVGKIKNSKKLNYIASYFLLIDYIAQNELFPKVSLYKDKGVLVKDVDMVIDIGNSCTTALLVEDNSNFNQVNQLELIDYTHLIKRNYSAVAMHL